MEIRNIHVEAVPTTYLGKCWIGGCQRTGYARIMFPNKSSFPNSIEVLCEDHVLEMVHGAARFVPRNVTVKIKEARDNGGWRQTTIWEAINASRNNTGSGDDQSQVPS